MNEKSRDMKDKFRRSSRTYKIEERRRSGRKQEEEVGGEGGGGEKFQRGRKCK